jgi:hypothetical protein
MSPFQTKTEAKPPQITPSTLALLASSPLGLFGSRWEQLSGYFLGEVWVLICQPIHYAKSRVSPSACSSQYVIPISRYIVVAATHSDHEPKYQKFDARGHGRHHTRNPGASNGVRRAG